MSIVIEGLITALIEDCAVDIGIAHREKNINEDGVRIVSAKYKCCHFCPTL